MGAIESPTQLKLTIDQFRRMAEAGVFAPDARVELINGAVYEMAPIGSLHASLVDRIAQKLTLRLGDSVIVGIQRPVQLPEDSEPQPDLMLLRARPDYYATRHPLPADVLLVIEVADGSLRFDRTVKAALYAQRGIAEYWVVDVNARTIEVHRDPAPAGYAQIRLLSGDASIAPAALPDCRFTPAELLG